MTHPHAGSRQRRGRVGQHRASDLMPEIAEDASNSARASASREAGKNPRLPKNRANVDLAIIASWTDNHSTRGMRLEPQPYGLDLERPELQSHSGIYDRQLGQDSTLQHIGAAGAPHRQRCRQRAGHRHPLRFV